MGAKGEREGKEAESEEGKSSFEESRASESPSGVGSRLEFPRAGFKEEPVLDSGASDPPDGRGEREAVGGADFWGACIHHRATPAATKTPEIVHVIARLKDTEFSSFESFSLSE